MAQGNGKKPFYKRIWVWVIVALIVIGFAGGGANSDSNKSSKASSSTSSPSKVKKDKGSSSSVKKTESYDYSKVEYKMSMEQVITAVGKQPTKRDDYTLFYGKDEFYFTDNKLIDATVKSVQSKIDKQIKAEQKTKKKQDLANAINAKINEINQATQESNGIDAILGVNGPNENNVYRVQLDDFILNGNDFQIKSAINSIHSQFIDILESNGKRNHIIYYYVGDTEIAKSKILNSSEVKLEK